jgi:hypothetical protein
MLNDFVQAGLVPTSPADCKKLMVSEIEDVFKEFAQESINITSLSRAVFGRFLQEAINARKLENARLWQEVFKEQCSVGKDNPTFWCNLYWRPADPSIEERFANQFHNATQR